MRALVITLVLLLNAADSLPSGDALLQHSIQKFNLSDSRVQSQNPSCHKGPDGCREADCKTQVPPSYAAYPEFAQTIGCYRIHKIRDCFMSGRCTWRTQVRSCTDSQGKGTYERACRGSCCEVDNTGNPGYVPLKCGKRDERGQIVPIPGCADQWHAERGTPRRRHVHHQPRRRQSPPRRRQSPPRRRQSSPRRRAAAPPAEPSPTPPDTSPVFWTRGGADENCMKVCGGSSECSEGAWPRSKQDFLKVLEKVGEKGCKSIEEGDWQVNPAKYVEYDNVCYWSAREPSIPRCGTFDNQWAVQRYCPCKKAREATTTSPPPTPPAPPPSRRRGQRRRKGSSRRRSQRRRRRKKTSSGEPDIQSDIKSVRRRRRAARRRRRRSEAAI